MGEPRRKSVQVLDTTALLAGMLEHGPTSLVTVQDVIDEVRFGGIAPERMLTAVESGLIQVKKPKPSYLKRVCEAAERTGDLHALSKADVNLLAVALEEREEGCDVILVSDDYSIQNTGIELGLTVRSSIHPPIRRPLKWRYICSGCGLEPSPPADVCPRCGSAVVKKRARNES